MSRYETAGFFDSEDELIFSTIAKTRKEKIFIRNMHEGIQNVKENTGLKCIRKRKRNYGKIIGDRVDIELIIN